MASTHSARKKLTLTNSLRNLAYHITSNYICQIEITEVYSGESMKNENDLTLSPATSAERIEMIDALRGFALAGVCLANLALFSFWNYLSNDQKSELSFPVINSIISYFIYFFVDSKFWTLFTFMFGFGTSLFISRAVELNKNGKVLFARRLLILLVIGLIHGTFFWSGDILSEYALAGLVLLIFSNKKGVSLAFWGIILGAVVPVVFKILQACLVPGTTEIFGKLNELTMEAYSSGSYCNVVNANIVINKTFSQYSWVHTIAALGRIMVGFWIGQAGLIPNIKNQEAIFQKTIRICALTGFPLMLIVTFARIMIDTEAFSPAWEPITFLMEPASMALGIFYAVSFLLLFQNRKWNRLLRPFKEMGRMALTNYLMQTIINMAIFSGIGLGLAGKTGPSLYILWFTVLIVSQLFFSRWWLKKFRFGPVEWLWRSLTYKKWQPMIAEAKP